MKTSVAFSMFLLGLTLNIPSMAQPPSGRKKASTPAKAQNTAAKTKPAASDALPRLPEVQWPFPKPDDPGIKIQCRWKKLGLLNGNGLFVEPVLMKGDAVVFEYGYGLSFRESVGHSPDPATLSVDTSYKEHTLTVMADIEDPSPSYRSITERDKEPEPKKRVGPAQVSDHSNRNPFANPDPDTAYNFNAKRPVILGGKFTVTPRSIKLAYDVPTFASILLGAKMENMPEYGIAFLSTCKLGSFGYALAPGEVTAIIQKPLKSDINAPDEAQKSIYQKVSRIVELLNTTMQQWAKKGVCLYDLLAPSDDQVSGNEATRLFASIQLPAQELSLVNDYKKASTSGSLSGPELLVLRMTVNRILLDRLLVAGWVAPMVQTGPYAGPNTQYAYRNEQLNTFSGLLGVTYGMNGGFTVLQERLQRFAITTRPTFVVDTKLEQIIKSN